MRLKDLLEDIVVDRNAYSKSDADSRVDMLSQEKRKWKKVPFVKAEFPLDDFEVIWDKNLGIFKTWEIAVRHIKSGEIAFSLRAEEEKIATDAGVVTGLSTELAAVSNKYSGRSLGTILYQFLIDNGQILFSSDVQSIGGKKLWVKMVEANSENVFLVVPGNSPLLSSKAFSQLQIPKTKTKNKTWTANVVIGGSNKDLLKLAYAKNDYNQSKLLIVPKDSAVFNKLKKIAVTKDDK